MQQTHKNFYYYLSYQLLALIFVSMFYGVMQQSKAKW